MGTMITDASLEYLQQLRELEYLNLYRTKVTNAGIDRLRPLTRLREVDLRYTRVSRTGIEHLQSTLTRAAFEFIEHRRKVGKRFQRLPEETLRTSPGGWRRWAARAARLVVDSSASV